jgi:hypothetical protein
MPTRAARIVLVAPEGTEWVAPATAFFAARKHIVARLPSLSFASFAVLRGGVAALLIDARLLEAGSAAFIAQLQRALPRLRVVTIGAADMAALQVLERGTHLGWPFAAGELEAIFPVGSH